MATTIYGCRNLTTGKIDFELCELPFLGCRYLPNGEHSGQVELTISGLYCDDIYYGCVDRGTGKFKIIIPDNCCHPDCDYCIDGEDLSISLSSVGCDCCVFNYPYAHIVTLNLGSHRVSQTSVSPCNYFGHFDGSFGEVQPYYDVDCEEIGTGSTELVNLEIWATIHSDRIHVIAKAASIIASPYYLVAEADCFNVEECGDGDGSFDWGPCGPDCPPLRLARSCSISVRKI